MFSNTERRYLKEAKKLITRFEAHYICEALNKVSTSGTGEIRWYISKELGGLWKTLEDWQEHNGINHTPAQRRQDRLDWIDWMLGEK